MLPQVQKLAALPPAYGKQNKRRRAEGRGLRTASHGLAAFLLSKSNLSGNLRLQSSFHRSQGDVIEAHWVCDL